MTSSINQKALNSRDRRIHLLVISIILLGPLVTLPALRWNGLNFLNLIFPITADSLVLEDGSKGFRDLSAVETLWLLVLVNILLTAVILWVRLLKNSPIGQLLTMFDVTIFIVCIGKLTMFSMYFSDNAERVVLAIGPVIFFGWCLTMGVLIRRHLSHLRKPVRD